MAEKPIAFQLIELMPGTFEWALIQMRAGKVVGLGSSLFKLQDGVILEFWRGDWITLQLMGTNRILATDWRVVEGDAVKGK